MLTVKAILDWRFLPCKFQTWLFNRATNVIEFINLACLIGIFIVLTIDEGGMYAVQTYHKLQMLPENYVLTVLGVTILLQLLPYVLKGLHKTAVSGYALLFSGLIWFVISTAYVASYPPLNLGMVFAPVFSFLCVLAGRNLIVFSVQSDKIDNCTYILKKDK